MAARLSVLEDELSCPVCCDIYRDPLVLRCSHSFCRACLEKIWEKTEHAKCPVCSSGFSREEPVSNLVLKNTCESLLQEGSRGAAAGKQCLLHGESLKLFCLRDKQPICVICQTSQLHKNHDCCPVEEAARGCQDELRGALTPLRANLAALRKHRQHCAEMAQHIQSQAQRAERRVKGEFERLHQFLQDEEAARISELREEEAEKSRAMKEKIESVAKEISSLSETIRVIEQDMAKDTLTFLQSYKDAMRRAQCMMGNPESVSGALINEAKHLGSLKYRVWEKMGDIIQYTPVTLEPNSANHSLVLSEDLTSLQYGERQSLPANPERFDPCVCVLGAEGFTSGRHFWDIEVGDNTFWVLGVAQESVKRREKFCTYPENGFWTIRLREGQYRAPRTLLAVTRRVGTVRVRLDWEGGMLSFCDPTDDTHLYTFTHTFTERLFPFFCTGCNSAPLTVLPGRAAAPPSGTVGTWGQQAGLDWGLQACPDSRPDSRPATPWRIMSEGDAARCAQRHGDGPSCQSQDRERRGALLAPPPGQALLAPPPGQALLAPPPGQALLAPPLGQALLAPPPGQALLAPPPGQALLAPPPGQALLAPPPGQALLAPPPGQALLAPVSQAWITSSRETDTTGTMSEKGSQLDRAQLGDRVGVSQQPGRRSLWCEGVPKCLWIWSWPQSDPSGVGGGGIGD
ncbi:nuclear factor 7, ovary-like [Megalops cyprinoides]|uniref:nuclear factor 7, ovary-like n=1 Tax=Megalops cyprinoides TaxID=118141 RepID=UPI001864772C|nr:nuclear factor 7, ovary-like [Megalops cyprinoides]